MPVSHFHEGKLDSGTIKKPHPHPTQKCAILLINDLGKQKANPQRPYRDISLGYIMENVMKNSFLTRLSS